MQGGAEYNPAIVNSNPGYFESNVVLRIFAQIDPIAPDSDMLLFISAQIDPINLKVLRIYRSDRSECSELFLRFLRAKFSTANF